jgi:hypothetical protein
MNGLAAQMKPSTGRLPLWSLFGAALVVLALALLSAPRSASALVDTSQPTQLEVDNEQSIDQFVARKFGTDAVQTCDLGCQALETEFARTPTNVLGAEETTGELFTLALDESSTALVPLITVPAVLGLGAVAVGVGGYLVWKYKIHGPQDRDYMLRVPEAADDPQFWIWSDGQQAGMFPTYYDAPDPLPFGYVGSGSWEGTAIWQTGTPDCTASAPQAAGLAGMEIYSWHWNQCWVPAGPPGEYLPVPIIAHGLHPTMAAVFGGNLPGVVIPPAAVDLGTRDGQTIDPNDLAARVHDEVRSGKTPDLNCAIDRGLGGDCHTPLQNYVTLPSCEGVSVATCTDRLQTAGITGTITTTTLDADHADPENGPDEVTDLYPNTGESVEVISTITLYKNPSSVPSVTPSVTSIANTLEANNPDTINSSNKRRLAKSCEEWANKTGSGATATDCTLRPVFFTGDDARAAAQHDENVLPAHPSWVVLNKRTIGENTSWYRNKPGCLTDDKTVASWQCDEYPLWSTMQGKGGSLMTDEPDIAWINGRENRRQGTAIRQFYSNNGAGDVFPKGCNIAPDDPEDWFLAIPIPAGIPLKTTWACNRPTP